MTPPIIAAEDPSWFLAPLDDIEKKFVGQYDSWQGPGARKVTLAPDRTLSDFGIVQSSGKWRIAGDSLLVRLDTGEVLISKMSPSSNFYGDVPLRRSGLTVLPRKTADVVRTSSMPRVRYRIASFYMDNTRHTAAIQRRVFDKFGYEVDQVKTCLSHGIAIDDYMVTSRGEFDYLLLFDIDCIPLHVDAIPTLVSNVVADDRILGAAAQSNHLNDNHPYASAACLALSVRLWEKMGQPSMRGSCHIAGAFNRADTAEDLTWAAEEDGVLVALLWPGHVEEKVWRLGKDDWTGYGTTHVSSDKTPLVYHAYQARFGSNRFINKCNEVLR